MIGLFISLVLIILSFLAFAKGVEVMVVLSILLVAGLFYLGYAVSQLGIVQKAFLKALADIQQTNTTNEKKGE